jgi:hypothetical protein
LPPQQVEDMRAALRELGLADQVVINEEGEGD